MAPMPNDLASLDVRFAPSQYLRPGEIVVVGDYASDELTTPDGRGVAIVRSRPCLTIMYDSRTLTEAEARAAFVEALTRSARPTERQTPNGQPDAGHA